MKELEFYKEDETSKIWQIETPDEIGLFLFSFDKKTIFNFFEDYPEKLTAEQIKQFKKEFPIMAALKD